MLVFEFALAIILVIVSIALSVRYIISGDEKAKRRLTEKIPRIPNKAYPQEGVCQCDDALAFHKVGGGACAITNCGCQIFIPSDIDSEAMKNITAATLGVLESNATNMLLEHQGKQRMLSNNGKTGQYVEHR